MDHSNYLLAALDENERAQLLEGAQSFALIFGETILQHGQEVAYVYFPERGVISIITEIPNGDAAEGGVTGSEGAAGLPEALGSQIMRSKGVVQAEGLAWRVSAAKCREIHSSSARFREASAKAAEFQVVEARQSLLCRSHHTVEQRLARWLLEMAERSNSRSRTLLMTQEILGVMLAVQRTTVTAVATKFRKAKLLSYARGKIQLLNVDGLEQAACSCRAIVREAEADILGRQRVWPAHFA